MGECLLGCGDGVGLGYVGGSLQGEERSFFGVEASVGRFVVFDGSLGI